MKLTPTLVLATAGLFAALAGVGQAAQVASPRSKVVSATVTVAPGQKGSVSANCPRGFHATGGGFKTDNVGANDSYPSVSQGGANGWTLTTHSPKAPKGGTASAGTATVYALCST